MEMNTEQARFNMIEQQIRPWDVLDPDVLSLLSVVRREDFVPAAYQAVAFADLEIPIGKGQVMLAPKIEAKLLQEAGIRKTDKVLEIGAGTGYMAALLAARAERVTTVEIDADLAAVARQNLARAGVVNAAVEVGDGVRGWPVGAAGAYDVIVVSGAVPLVPEELLKQLKVGGRLVAIVGEAPVMSAQLVTCVGEGAYNRINLFETCTATMANAPQPARFEF